MRWSWSARKLCLIALSYVFYAAWYPWAVSLLLASTLFDFHVGKALENPRFAPWRRLLLIGSIALNLGVLFSFKYLGFAISNLNDLAGALGSPARWQAPSTVLPVGISFYTFMSLSYVIDVYRGVRRAERSLLDFALFLSFFPHLVAGPIVRAEDFLPQCKRERRPTSQAILWGLALLLFGLFQKVVLADGWFAPISDRVFAAQPERLSTVDAWLGAVAFSGQIFCDFAGYSTCAIGAAACLGYHLPENFRSPYTALGFSDFWRRWHITLSSWLRDYVYVPLGGNRVARWRIWLNLMLTMLLGGLWHGASWTFVVWGALHGAFLCGERGVRWVAARFQLASTPLLSLVVVLVTLLSVTWAWIFFRAPSVSFAFEMTRRLCGLGGASDGVIAKVDALLIAVPALGLLAAQWLGRDRSLAELADKAPRPLLAAGLIGLLVAIVTMAGEDRAFIYFQF